MRRRPAAKRPPRAAWILGIVSFLNDTSSEMLYPLLPIFITQVLGAPVAILGVIDGVAEGGSAVFKTIFGRWSDRLGRRRPFVVAGYLASALSKLVVAVSRTWGVVFVGRVLDKFGKGLRTGARDALLLDAATPATRGFVFGFQQSLDSAGAVVGPLVALGLLEAFRHDIRTVLYLAIIPSLAAVFTTVLVRDVAAAASPARPDGPDSDRAFAASSAPRPRLAALPRDLKVFLVASGLFALGNSSDGFLILRSRNVGLSLALVVLAYVLYNVVYSAVSTPAGRLADRIGPRRVYLAGVLIYVVVYVGFALNRSARGVWALFALYGVYIALTESVGKALVGGFIADHRDAAGVYGLQQTVTSIGLVLASVVGGVLWSTIGSWATFAFAALCAASAFLVFAVIRGDHRSRVTPATPPS